jgi:hypothetical protein
MGPGIVIPVVFVLVIAPITMVFARRFFTRPVAIDEHPERSAALRLTSQALRTLDSPPWRVIYEIAPDKLGEVEHVLIGPAGAFPVRTSMERLPEALGGSEPDRLAVAAASIMRGPLDEALRRCALSSDRLIWIHWGANPADADDAAPASVDPLPGVTAVDGRRLAEWAAALPDRLVAAQVDLAWQTVLTQLGRPDPLR